MNRSKKTLVGRVAFKQDFHCDPHETGNCRIVGVIPSHPELVVVEWGTGDEWHHKAGSLSIVELRILDVR